MKKDVEFCPIYPKTDTIYVGDCILWMSRFKDNSFDTCITDPPYNMSNRPGMSWAFSSHVTLEEKWDAFKTREQYLSFCRSWLSEVCRVVKDNGNILIFGSYHNIYDIGYLLNCLDRKILNSIVWEKSNPQPNITCRMFTESTEHIIWACNNSRKKAKKWTFNYQDMKRENGGKQMKNVWKTPVTPKSERIEGYPSAQKPVGVISRLVRACTETEDHVLDCFGGSGTTAVACNQENRSWTLIEAEQEYVDMATKRIIEDSGIVSSIRF